MTTDNRGICMHYRLNLRVAATFCMLMYAGAAWAQFALTELIVPGFGVPLTVLAMSAAGSLVGFAYTPPVTSRQKLYTLALANTLMASWLVILIPEWRGWSVSHVALPPLAGIVAAANCVIVPAVFKRLPDIVGTFIDRFFKSSTPGGTP